MNSEAKKAIFWYLQLLCSYQRTLEPPLFCWNPLWHICTVMTCTSFGRARFRARKVDFWVSGFRIGQLLLRLYMLAKWLEFESRSALYRLHEGDGRGLCQNIESNVAERFVQYFVDGWAMYTVLSSVLEVTLLSRSYDSICSMTIQRGISLCLKCSIFHIKYLRAVGAYIRTGARNLQHANFTEEAIRYWYVRSIQEATLNQLSSQAHGEVPTTSMQGTSKMNHIS